MEQYQTIKHIGKGACGIVLLVRHMVTGRLYAMKRLELNEQSTTTIRQAMIKEVSILSRLRHPHIVRCHEWFFDVPLKHLFIVLDYCDNGTLEDRIHDCKRNGQFLHESLIMHWFVQIVMAVSYMHSQNVLHRDLKPSNIFLMRQNIAKVGDFGIGKELQSTFDAAKTCVGIPGYLSPELCQDKIYNTKSDIWAVGCLLYEMCALKPAFDANNNVSLLYKIVKGDYESIPSVFSHDLNRLIRIILATYPDNRPSASVILAIPYVQRHLDLFIDEKENLKLTREVRNGMLKPDGTPCIFRHRRSTDLGWASRLSNCHEVGNEMVSSPNVGLLSNTSSNELMVVDQRFGAAGEALLLSPVAARRGYQGGKMRHAKSLCARTPSPLPPCRSSLSVEVVDSPVPMRRCLTPGYRSASVATSKSLKPGGGRNNARSSSKLQKKALSIEDTDHRSHSALDWRSSSRASGLMHTPSHDESASTSGPLSYARFRIQTSTEEDTNSTDSEIPEELPTDNPLTADSDHESNGAELDEWLDIPDFDTPDLELQYLTYDVDDSDENDELREWSDLIAKAKEAREVSAIERGKRQNRFRKVLSDSTPEHDDMLLAESNARRQTIGSCQLFMHQFGEEKSKSWTQ